MLIEVEGDILLSKADAIVHGVAPNDDFKQGLALSLREKWPAFYKDFRHFCKTYHPKSGEMWMWGGPGIKVINLFTQEGDFDNEHGHGKATEHHVNNCLHELKKELEKGQYKSIAITKVATGVGGLKWEHVKPLLEKQLADVKIPVYVYTQYKKGVAAAESA
ncbi:MAG: macro domain-containing protein [Bdellovibrio sp.]